jgi:hypothetical protein
MRIHSHMRHLLLCTVAALGVCVPAIAQVPAENQVVRLLVGHSTVIRTDPRLTRVLVGNPQS